MVKYLKHILLLTILFNFLPLKAQIVKKSDVDNDIKLSALPYYSYGKGLGITSPDSLFQLNIRFRMQNRVTYLQNDNENAAYQGEIRRLRLRFDGYVGNPKFLYVLQLSFAPGDVGEIEEGENINIIRDAAIIYRPNKRWNILFGQTKLPGNRQRVNSSGALQLSDRSINNSKFNVDRDFGFQLYYLNENKAEFSYALKTAVTTGEGRNWTKSSDNGVALTGKVELYPLGTFTRDGQNFEGDFARETQPKLLLSGAFSQNNLSRRTQGQTGDDLYEQRTTKALLADLLFKYKGWAFMSSYMSRTAKNPITYNSDGKSNYVYVGHGTDYQLSYLLPSNYEIITRYSQQQVHRNIQHLTPHTQQYTVGVTKYIWEHAFKLQTEVTYSNLNYYNLPTKNNFYVRFQIEMGI